LRKGRDATVWSVAGVWKLKISGGNIDKGTRPLRVGEGNVRHKLLDHTETTDWGMRLFNGKWLNINKVKSYRKILRCTNKDRIRNLNVWTKSLVNSSVK
jgi:hypothetical protein